MTQHQSTFEPAARVGPPQNLDPATGQSSPPTPRPSWRSDELLGDRTEVLIVHGTEIYRLRRTRQGKLILYK